MVCKFHAVMTPTRLAFTVCCSLTLFLGAACLSPAHAEKADRLKKMEIESELPGKVDLQNRKVVFNGNVAISKGTMSIRASRIEISEGSDGYQHAVAIGSAAVPARFRQKREGLNEFIEGEAERLEYNSSADTISFINKAMVRRLRGSTPADKVTGSVIVYDNRAEIFTVSGGATERVRVTLMPSAAEAASEPASEVPR